MLESSDTKKSCIAAELWQEYERNLSTIKSLNFDFKVILNRNNEEKDRFENAPNTPF